VEEKNIKSKPEGVVSGGLEDGQKEKRGRSLTRGNGCPRGSKVDPLKTPIVSRCEKFQKKKKHREDFPP